VVSTGSADATIFSEAVNGNREFDFSLSRLAIASAGAIEISFAKTGSGE
jgi:hypothetical protein